MKVVTAKEMARIEQLAYAKGSSEEAFMLKAAEGIASLAQNCIARYHLKPHITLLCGKGNNGGDALAAGLLLSKGDFSVNALAIAPYKECSHLNQKQAKRFLAHRGTITDIKKASDISFMQGGLLIDGLLGTGFKGEVKGILRTVIERANSSKLPILSIDIPSGINGTTGEIGGVAIKAADTLFLGLPKRGCFIGDAWNYVGRVHTYDFGLGQKWISEAKEEFTLLEENEIASRLPPIVRTRHKYQAGYVVGIGGTYGMPGAPILASFASLRSGAGIVRLLHPQGMELELSGAPYELIREGYKPGTATQILEATKRATSLFIGPGLGISLEAKKMLKTLLPKIEKPCVIDAEALTLISQNKISLPPQAVLTPHHGEMKKLLHLEDSTSFQELLDRTQDFAQKQKVVIVLKGAPTFILSPQGNGSICPRGDPGMATAGSGDVLTGIIAAFLAQGLSPLSAAEVGVYLHGVAGEIASEKMTSYSLVASDIISALPEVFKAFIKASSV